MSIPYVHYLVTPACKSFTLLPLWAIVLTITRTEAFIGTKDDAEFRKQFEATVPLRRGLDNNDLASAAIFLCSDEASFVTGVNLKIDGGSTCV